MFAQSASNASEAPANARTVALLRDSAPLNPLEMAQHLVNLVGTHSLVDDNYLESGAVDALEKAMAALLGKTDAAFMPIGTLANQLAVRILCGEYRHAIVHQSKSASLSRLLESRSMRPTRRSPRSA